MRRLLLTSGFGLIVWAALVVPLPLVVLEPVPAQPVSSVIQLADPSDDISGSVLFTAVSVHQTTTVGSITAWWDPHRDVDLRTQLIPEGMDPEQFLDNQREVFAESLRVAAGVGMREAGLEVSIEGDGARVLGVVPGSPAEGHLEPGDVVVAAAGQEIGLASELVTAVDRLESGERVQLEIRRDGDPRELTITVRPLPQRDQPGLGVLISTVNQQISLPKEVTVAENSRIGGASAGLMMALTVFDRMEPSDLTDGRAVAGSGTVDTSGNVGPVGGIAQKVRGAELTDARIFLVSDEQVEEARRAAGDELEVIGVGTVREAIEALQRP